MLITEPAKISFTKIQGSYELLFNNQNVSSAGKIINNQGYQQWLITQ